MSAPPASSSERSQPQPSALPARLCASQLSVRLGERLVVRDVSLELEPAQRVAIVGPNGSGKTTILRALAGLIPAASGRVTLDGQPLRSYSRRELARRIAYMPQSSDLDFPMTGLEAVLLGRSPHKHGLALADADDHALALRAMHRLDVAHLAGRSVTAVSGGERQRLMLARVLVQECPFLLLDEPSSAQDPRGVLRMVDVLAEKTAADRGALVAVHDLSLALTHFERVVVLADGGQLASGAPAEILASGALEEAFGIELKALHDGDHIIVIPRRAQPL